MSDAPNHMLDLDALEREGDPGLFRFALGGEEYFMVDPSTLDYRELLAAQDDVLIRRDVSSAIGKLLPADHRERFFANSLPTYKLEALFKSYSQHYGLTPTPGEATASS